jgi:putative transcriptional regulator
MKNRLREFREEKGLTQEELATAVGVSRQSIIAIERGRFTPSTLLALKMGRLLNRSVEEIFLLD